MGIEQACARILAYTFPGTPNLAKIDSDSTFLATLFEIY